MSSFVAVWFLQAALARPAPFPMTEGTRWTYRGTARGDYKRADVTRRVQTTMDVMEHAVIGKYEVATIDGEPSSVGCFGPEELREARKLFTVLIRHGNRYYEMVTPDPSPLTGELTTEEEVTKALDGAALVLETPLHGRTKAGHWTVQELPRRKILGRTRQPYRLTYRTGADHESVEFVEGLGITRWQSVHHADPCEVDLRLTAVRRP